MGERKPIGGLFGQLMELGGEAMRARIAAQLRRGSVFFSYVDTKAERVRIAGSGVIADLFGTRVVFTAAHVLEDFRSHFEDGKIALSVNRLKGRFMLPSSFPRLVTAGGASGADAGVIVLPDVEASTYFNFGGFEPPRAQTVKAHFPPLGMDCAIAGWPATLGVPTRDERIDSIVLGLQGGFQFLGTGVTSTDEIHFWLDASGPMQVQDSDEKLELRAGDLAGMSGCGCWVIEADPELFEPHVLADPVLLKTLAEKGGPSLSLYGVHTGTGDGKLRETPMLHHLRLLAEMNKTMHDKVKQLWPTLDV